MHRMICITSHDHIDRPNCGNSNTCKVHGVGKQIVSEAGSSSWSPAKTARGANMAGKRKYRII